MILALYRNEGDQVQEGSMNIIDLQRYKRNKLAEQKRLENKAMEEEMQYIIDCLGIGAPGLHDLVQNHQLTDDRRHSLGLFL